MKTPRPLFLAAALLAASPLLAADTYAVDKGHSEAAFTIKHLVSKVSGRFTEFGGSITLVRQEHAGAVTTASASVQYAYAESTGSGGIYSRLASMTYPDGAVLGSQWEKPYPLMG